MAIIDHALTTGRKSLENKKTKDELKILLNTHFVSGTHGSLLIKFYKSTKNKTVNLNILPSTFTLYIFSLANKYILFI